MKIVTSKPKIAMTRSNRKSVETQYAQYKKFASRHANGLPKLDPLVSKRLKNERKDEMGLPHKHLMSSASKASMQTANSRAYPLSSIRKSGSVPQMNAHTFDHNVNYERISDSGHPELMNEAQAY